MNVFAEYMFKAADDFELSCKIKSILFMSESKRKTVGQSMRQRVIEEFSIEDFIERHQNLYLNLVKSSRNH